MSKVLHLSGGKLGKFMVGSPQIYLASPKYLYVASPKNIYLSSPKHFYLASPQLWDDFSIKVWRAQLEERIKSDDSYARKFLNEVDELAKKIEPMKERVVAFKKDFDARVEQREERIWG
ncbi:MAG: hypothetical protein H3Z54_12200 [archaeon]|nr:hypothetical protein [archaeon]